MPGRAGARTLPSGGRRPAAAGLRRRAPTDGGDLPRPRV